MTDDRLTYRSDWPAVPGWYWCRKSWDNHTTEQIVRVVHLLPDGILGQQVGEPNLVGLDWLGNAVIVDWAGPLERPA